MPAGRLLFAKLMDHWPPIVFERCAARYGRHHNLTSFTCRDQSLCIALVQLPSRDSPRGIEVGLRSLGGTLYHIESRGQVSRNALANANAPREWRIYAAFPQRLISNARQLCADAPSGVGLRRAAYALDSTAIDLSLSLFRQAPFHTSTVAVPLHTLLDLRHNMPSFIHITDGTLHDVNILDRLVPEAGACYVRDRGYINLACLYPLDHAGGFFVTPVPVNHFEMPG